MPTASRRGRAAEALRNDERIIQAARSVFGANPGASISEVGQAAGVGMSALYRRYASKEELLTALLDEARLTYEREIDCAQERLAASEDPWAVYSDFLAAIVDANVHFVSAGTPALATIFERRRTQWDKVTDQNRALFTAVRDRGVLRAGAEFADIGVLLQAISAVRGESQTRSRTLRRRTLTIVLDGLRAELPPLTGTAATGVDYRAT
ncbi:AcrR family transcriptional regulator [Nakamurella sp. UYEF19]|uniref:TetR/AcrR family transcriptional regulator n=1 Tax=Nakamurella sp. UYEF19 TaxID=1756392 RepID=UPI0033983E82